MKLKIYGKVFKNMRMTRTKIIGFLRIFQIQLISSIKEWKDTKLFIQY
jgi:hypothetical protein